MNDIERMLQNAKHSLDGVQAPQEMEERLTRALEGRRPVKRRTATFLKVAVVLISVILAGYNFDTMAFYGKKLIGYNNVMNGTLQDLNELGKGQIINKSYKFENGVSLTLDGIMLDENQLLAFYTVRAPQGNVEEAMPLFRLSGISGECIPGWGQGELNDDRTVLKSIQSFESPRFFEKTLCMSFSLPGAGKAEKGEITFSIDREKAMGHVLKKPIGKSVRLESANIRFDSVLASSTQTVIKGTVKNTFELAVDEISAEMARLDDIDLRLIANGNQVQLQGGGMSTDLSGISFSKEYDALPKDLKSLKLELIGFSVERNVSETVDIDKDTKGTTFLVDNQHISVDRVLEKEGRMFVEISSDENTVLTKIYLLADGQRRELVATTGYEYEKLDSGKIVKSRILEFEGTGKDCKLQIMRIKHSESCNEKVNIPID